MKKPSAPVKVRRRWRCAYCRDSGFVFEPPSTSEIACPECRAGAEEATRLPN